MDTATFRLNYPRGRLSEKSLNWHHLKGNHINVSFSKIRHEDIRPLFIRSSGSGDPPWILKRDGLESSGRMASS